MPGGLAMRDDCPGHGPGYRRLGNRLFRLEHDKIMSLEAVGVG